MTRGNCIPPAATAFRGDYKGYMSGAATKGKRTIRFNSRAEKRFNLRIREMQEKCSAFQGKIVSRFLDMLNLSDLGAFFVSHKASSYKIGRARAHARTHTNIHKRAKHTHNPPPHTQTQTHTKNTQTRTKHTHTHTHKRTQKRTRTHVVDVSLYADLTTVYMSTRFGILF
jgi:hypothetical protein